MLTPDDNARLTKIEPGSAMGALLRRYWHPVAAIAELEDKPTKALRLFGEDLVLYRDLGGHFGLISRRCPHRGFDLSYGRVEEKGLRCRYHGWCYDERGACIDQPFEQIEHPAYKDKVRATAYPVEAKAGLLWAYLGPAPAPLLPTWEPFTWPNGFVYTCFTTVPCNWLQCHENSIDPVHFEWLHMNWLRDQYPDEGHRTAPRHMKLQFSEFEFGFRYGRLVEGQTEDDELWTIGRVSLWPNGFFTGGNFNWRVPIDDRNTLCVDWNFIPVHKHGGYQQRRIPYNYLPLFDQNGALMVDNVVHQDFSAFVLQGETADRTREHLGASDRGVIMLRKKLLEQATRVQAGEEPFGLVRDPARNVCIELPIPGKRAFLEPVVESGFGEVQRNAMLRHLISGLSKETIEMWSEAFGEPPPFA